MLLKLIQFCNRKMPLGACELSLQWYSSAAQQFFWGLAINSKSFWFNFDLLVSCLYLHVNQSNEGDILFVLNSAKSPNKW